MADHRITLQRVKNHWAYGWWKYLLMAAFVIFGVNIFFTVTAYKPPENRRIELYLCSGWADTERVYEEMWPAILEVAPDQEELVVMNIDLINGDYTAAMQFSTYIAAQQGDVLLLPKSELKRLASDAAWEAFADLTPYLDSGLLDVRGIDLSAGTYCDEEGGTGVYAVPADTLYGLTAYGIDPANCMLAVTSFSGNEENAVRVLDMMLERYQTPKPEGYDAWHEQRKASQTGGTQIFQ